jgi:4-amino-4-deoxy-L-arabinose transferase-like glycosyltransferase
MKDFVSKNHRLLFYSCWLLLCLVQSAFTELLDDEAYYWVYSKFPAWGYFDHPPMVAIMIKAGYSIFHNELGVRLISVFMNLFSLVIIEKLIPEKTPKLFYAIALSLAVLQVSGFVAAPDIPLIFFTALFFLAYKKFITRASFLHILFLALVMALLLYSKYHGVLVIFFVLVSNLKLFTR